MVESDDDDDDDSGPPSSWSISVSSVALAEKTAPLHSSFSSAMMLRDGESPMIIDILAMT